MGTRHSARHPGRRRGLSTVLASVLLMANQVFVVLPSVQAATSDIRLAVTSART